MVFAVSPVLETLALALELLETLDPVVAEIRSASVEQASMTPAVADDDALKQNFTVTL